MNSADRYVIRYFECVFGTEEDRKYSAEECDHYSENYSECILGVRKPTLEEATEFLSNDLNTHGYECIIDVLEISEDEANTFFDMEHADVFPVFGLEV